MHVGYCSTDICAILTDIIKSAQELKPRPSGIVVCVSSCVSSYRCQQLRVHIEASSNSVSLMLFLICGYRLLVLDVSMSMQFFNFI